MNALINSNNSIVERARMQVGNLAHSLKTPLAVLANEIVTLPGNKNKLLLEHTETINKQVKLYLDRARISARHKTSLVHCQVLPVTEKVISVISKLNPELVIQSNLTELVDVKFAGEEPDLQEVIGNLLENAAKYSKGQISISSKSSQNHFVIHIDDDGIGMTSKQIDEALKRGGRADEGKQGWGLGLSIVRDIIDEYSGEFYLQNSNLGGLRVTISLPTVF